MRAGQSRGSRTQAHIKPLHRCKYARGWNDRQGRPRVEAEQVEAGIKYHSGWSSGQKAPLPTTVEIV